MRKLPRLLVALRDRLNSALALQDYFVFGGLGMVFYGLYAVYPPSAWIVVGAVLFLLGGRL